MVEYPADRASFRGRYDFLSATTSTDGLSSKCCRYARRLYEQGAMNHTTATRHVGSPTIADLSASSRSA